MGIAFRGHSLRVLASSGSSLPVSLEWRMHNRSADGLKSRLGYEGWECRCMSSYSYEADRPRESRFYVQEQERVKREEEENEKNLKNRWRRKHPSRRARPKSSPKNYKANREGYKDLVFKWFMQAYPESLSRQEIAGRLRAHPKKVKELIIKGLVKEGKLLKWGQRSPPYERYMPVIKAPEYYEVTGEEPPLMPDIDEAALVSPEKYAKRYKAQPEEGPRVPAAEPGFQDLWDEGGKLDEAEVQKLRDINELQGWDELFEDPSDEEESEEEQEEEEAVLLKRMKLSREREIRRAKGEEVDSDENETESDEDEDESALGNTGGFEERGSGADVPSEDGPTPAYSEMLAGSFEGLALDSSENASSALELHESHSESPETRSSEGLTQAGSFVESSVDVSEAVMDGTDSAESLTVSTTKSQSLDRASSLTAQSSDAIADPESSCEGSQILGSASTSSGPSQSYGEESVDNLDYSSTDDGEFLNDEGNDEGREVPTNRWGH